MNNKGQILIILAVLLGSMLISFASLIPNFNISIFMLTPPKQALTSMYHNLEINAIAYASRIYIPDRVSFNTPNPQSISLQAESYILYFKSKVENARVNQALWSIINITDGYLFKFTNLGAVLSLNSTVSALALWNISKPHVPVDINTSYKVELTLQDLSIVMNPYRYGFIYNSTIKYIHIVDNIATRHPELNFTAYTLNSITGTWVRTEILKIIYRGNGIYNLAIDIGVPLNAQNPYVIVQVEDSCGVILWFKCQA
ncbi:MAG: hypothetical protein QW511_00830 [Candidatus Methanomethylicia archaeon]